MKNQITTIAQLDSFLAEMAPDFVKHDYVNDGDLPSYSLEALCQEGAKAVRILRHEMDEDSPDNYVPAYWGYGLFSRSLATAQKLGAEPTNTLFSELGANEDESELLKILTSKNWY